MKESLTGKSVLIIDDEGIVVEALEEVLGKICSVVDKASNGAEGLVKTGERDFDFILLDLEMPKMNGYDFFRHLSEIKPHLIRRIIFITGDTETLSTREFIAASGCPFIDKPFMIKDLVKMLVDLSQGSGNAGCREAATLQKTC